MTVGSLFSGIGGFDLGLERAGFTIKWQVEIDGYARKVLAKHWPSIPKYGDIRAIDWSTVETVDVLCGGFPCQDLSYAGKRAGLRKGTRSGLWFEFIRAISTLRPQFIIVENVPGLLTNPYMGQVLKDLAESGYDAEWDCLPAAMFGATHYRDRVWILAHTAGIYEISPLGISERLQKQLRGMGREIPSGHCWGIHKPDLVGMANGVPRRMDRIKGLGNAIVPQIAEAIGQMILECEKERTE